MATAPESRRIFISSPGDVAEERALTRRVIERLAGEFAGRVELEPIYWEHEPLRATGSWHEQVFPPSEADIVLCILWSRLGTRQPAEITRPDGSRYESGTEYEFEEAWRAYQERGQPDLLVYRKTKEPRVRLRDKAALMERIGQKEALDRFIDTWFQDREEGTLIAAFHPFESADDFEELVEIHLRKLLEERLPSTGVVPARRVKVWTAGSPFRGLEAFEFAHAEVFSGRTQATSEVVDALREQAASGRPFVLVLGMSGCGKSSLVRAGVLPLLTQPGVIEGVGLWRRAIVRPSDGGGDPFVGLATALLAEDALPELGADGTGPEELAKLLRESPEAAFALIKGGLSQAAAEVAREEELTRQPEARLALVVDQLEELFTTEAIDQEDRRRFTEALRALAGSGRVWVLGTLRSDFYPRLAELPALVELKEGAGQYDLLPPGPAEIGQMIRRPAQLTALAFEERQGTDERLDDVLRDAAAQNPEALPLLQFTLEELYTARTQEGVLSFAAYEELGGVEGALAQRAEAVLESLAPEARAALPVALSRLVRVDAEGVDGATRQRARLEAFPAGSPERAAVERFVEARLCVTDRDEQGTAVVSLAHEALLAHWPRLRQWLEHNRELLRMRERLDAAAAQWEAEGRPAASLLASGKRLAEAEELEAAEGIELPEREHAFLQASIAKGRRTRWLKRAAVAALGVLTLLAAAGAWYANRQRAEAEVARGESEAVTDFLSDMLASVDPEELGRDVLVKDVLDQASTKIDELADQPLIQARLMSTIGTVDVSLALYDDARPLLEQALTIRQDSLPPSDPLIADSMNRLALLLDDLEEHEEARGLLEQALAIREAALGPDSPLVAKSLNNLAVLLDRKFADYEAAKALHERALGIREAAFGPDHPEVAKSVNNLATIHWTLDDYPAARPLLERALAIRENHFGPDHPTVIASIGNLGLLYEMLGEYGEARPLYERALTSAERTFGPEHPRVAHALVNLGIVSLQLADFGRAEGALRRALALQEVSFGSEHSYVASTLGNLAWTLTGLGRYGEAIELRRRSLAIYESSLGAGHPAVADGLTHLGILEFESGEYDRARGLFERALGVRRGALPEAHPAVASSLSHLAMVATRSGDHEEATRGFDRALEIMEDKLGPDHPETAEVLLEYGELLRRTGRFDEAKETLERSLRIMEDTFGSDHPQVASRLHYLAKVLRETGETRRAEELFQQALHIRRERLGAKHPDAIETLEDYARLLREQGRDEDADNLS